MKEGFIIKANWLLFQKAIIKNLHLLGIRKPEAFYKRVKKNYKMEMKKIPEYGKNDVLKLNLAHAVMLGEIYRLCRQKPDVDVLTKFYHDFVFSPWIVRFSFGHMDIIRSAEKEVRRGMKSQKSTHPFTWKYKAVIEDKDRFTATFSKCGICEYLKSRGMEKVIPAMCALDYSFAEHGNHLFQRNTTIATGGSVCDCHYIRKRAATQAEKRKAVKDRENERKRGRL